MHLGMLHPISKRDLYFCPGKVAQSHVHLNKSFIAKHIASSHRNLSAQQLQRWRAMQPCTTLLLYRSSPLLSLSSSYHQYSSPALAVTAPLECRTCGTWRGNQASSRMLSSAELCIWIHDSVPSVLPEFLI